MSVTGKATSFFYLFRLFGEEEENTDDWTTVVGEKTVDLSPEGNIVSNKVLCPVVC